ncbi:hypothetical protein [Streptomyces chartreusis]|uniref:hypothetical protein n=1 Tax=Streptomyces chartreusis TaxID=1969 RepID=UPI00381D6509
MSETHPHEPAADGWQYSPTVRTWTRMPEPNALPSWRSVLDALELPPGRLREFLAIHESAHAVVAAAHPFYASEGEPVMRLRWVGLAPSAVPRNGQVLNAGLCSVSYESGTNWWDVAAHSVAGERATVRWLREEGLWTPLRGWIAEASSAGDRRNIDALDGRFRIAWNSILREVYAEHGICPVRFDDLLDRADDLLDWLWPAVGRTAGLLQRHGRLTGPQVRALLEPHLDADPDN